MTEKQVSQSVIRLRDRNGDGYTNLEEYLDWLADPRGRFPDRHPAISGH